MGFEPKIEMKIIDLRELGETDRHWVEGFLRYFRDIYLYGSVFAYCKNSYFCVYESYYTHFWPIYWRVGACYDPYDFQQYFLYGYFNQLLHEGRTPTESEVEQKILEFYKTHLRIPIRRPITIYKIYEAVKTLWVVMLPKEDCFG